MARRAVYSFVGFLIITYLTILRVYAISIGTQLAETAQQQSTYRLSLASTRGTFYDCAMRPLTGQEQKTVAAIAPVTEAAARLSEILPSGQMAEDVYKRQPLGLIQAIVEKLKSLIHRLGKTGLFHADQLGDHGAFFIQLRIRALIFVNYRIGYFCEEPMIDA